MTRKLWCVHTLNRRNAIGKLSAQIRSHVVFEDVNSFVKEADYKPIFEKLLLIISVQLNNLIVMQFNNA